MNKNKKGLKMKMFNKRKLSKMLSVKVEEETFLKLDNYIKEKKRAGYVANKSRLLNNLINDFIEKLENNNIEKGEENENNE